MSLTATLGDMTTTETEEVITAIDPEGDLVTMTSKDLAEMLTRFSAINIILKNAEEMVEAMKETEHAVAVDAYYEGLVDAFRFVMTGQLPGVPGAQD